MSLYLYEEDTLAYTLLYCILDYILLSEQEISYIKLIIWETHKIIWGLHFGSRSWVWDPLRQLSQQCSVNNVVDCI